MSRHKPGQPADPRAHLAPFAGRTLPLTLEFVADFPPSDHAPDHEAKAAVCSSEAGRHQLAALAKFMIKIRRQRTEVFAGIAFGEPAWDILLDLYVHHVAGRSVAASSLSVAAAVPSTTALRWINQMLAAGQLVRRPDPSDRRRVYITLVPELIDAIEAYLSRVLHMAAQTFPYDVRQRETVGR